MITLVDIPTLENEYAVCKDGNVYSLKYGKVRKLTPCKNKKGYLRVSLSINNKQKSFLVHRLVYSAFILKRMMSEDESIDHINDIKHDNRVDNLRVISNRDNVIKAKIKTKKTSKHTGVCYDKGVNKFRSQIYIGGKQRYIGIWNTEEEAKEAYLNAKKELGL